MSKEEIKKDKPRVGEKRHQQKKQKKKNLSDALRKNLLRRKSASN